MFCKGRAIKYAYVFAYLEVISNLNISARRTDGGRTAGVIADTDAIFSNTLEDCRVGESDKC
jgi:hypothetical protein